MWGINICVKSREAPLADFEIPLLFYGVIILWELNTIRNWDKNSVFVIFCFSGFDPKWQDRGIKYSRI